MDIDGEEDQYVDDVEIEPEERVETVTTSNQPHYIIQVRVSDTHQELSKQFVWFCSTIQTHQTCGPAFAKETDGCCFVAGAAARKSDVRTRTTAVPAACRRHRSRCGADSRRRCVTAECGRRLAEQTPAVLCRRQPRDRLMQPTRTSTSSLIFGETRWPEVGPSDTTFTWLVLTMPNFG